MDIAADLAPTGTLRASINLGNPVLAQGTPEAPSGVTVDIARELGARLGVPVELVCFGAAKDSLAAIQRTGPTSASSPWTRHGPRRSRSPRRTP